MTRRARLVLELQRIAEDYRLPECWEAADRLERAEEAADRVKRYVAIRREHDNVAPGWPDLAAVLSYVEDVPAWDAETKDTPAEAQEVAS